jgi:hypothetical protein
MSPTRKNNMRKNKKSTRKGSRKAGRKGSRKDRKGSRKDRKDRKDRKQTGGNPMEQSLAQGRQFAEIHSAQHGGAYLTGAPISQIDGSMLEPGLRDFARVGGLDASVAEASTQRDPDQMAQSGGRRNRKASKKSKKSTGSQGLQEVQEESQGLQEVQEESQGWLHAAHARPAVR